MNGLDVRRDGGGGLEGKEGRLYAAVGVFLPFVLGSRGAAGGGAQVGLRYLDSLWWARAGSSGGECLCVHATGVSPGTEGEHRSTFINHFLS